MTITDDTQARKKRGRVVMLVDNRVHGDSRVQKEAASAAAAGWDVILLGASLNGPARTWQVGGAEVRLLPMPSPLLRRRHQFRRAWLRAPFAYPPSGIAAYRKRTNLAWRLDLRVRQAELEVRSATSGARSTVQRGLLRLETIAAQVTGRWVRSRARQLERAHKDRGRLDGWWDRAYTAFWRTIQGDGAWRRLEPRLWDFELAFGPVIDELKPDLIHANDFYMLGVAGRAVVRARAAGRTVRLVWDAHEFLPGIRARADNLRWMLAHRGYEREFVKYADAAVTVSDELADMLRDEHGLAARPAVVLNAPEVDRTVKGGDVQDIREQCGLGPEVPLVVYSGAAAPQRGFDIMVEALPHLDGVHVGLVMSFPLASFVTRVLARAEQLGVSDRVHVVPYVAYDQVVAFLSTADIGVIPIHHWPNHEIALITKFFEYAHARLPIVVSDVKAMAHVTRSTGLGEVFRAEDVEDYVRAIKAVLTDPKRYRAVYDNTEVLEQWTWAAQAKILDGVYERLVPSMADAR